MVGLLHDHIAGMPFQVPARTNKVLQKPGSLQCGLLVMHYIEEEARRCLGEGKAAAGYPDPKAVQANLWSLLKVLTPRYVKLQEYSKAFEDVDAGFIAASKGEEEAMVFMQNQQELLDMQKKAKEAMHEGDAVTGDMAPLEGQALMDWACEMLERLTEATRS